ncbi:TrbI/VirB10 family protein [Rhodanobacter sp. BL-MT-08]
MSSNTPNQPGDGSDYGSVPPNESRPGRADPLAGNPYSTQYRQSEAPDLDAGAPELRSNDLRRMNRRALVFLGAIVVLLIIVAFWMLKGASGKNEAPAKQREETITVPEAPKQTPRPLPSLPPQPIPLAPPLPPPPPTAAETEAKAQMQAPRGPTLLERRIGANDSAGGGYGQQASGQQGAGVPGFPGQPGAARPGGLGGEQPDVATSAQPLLNADTLMLRGTYIRCVLETRIISDIPGFTSCVVTEPVYSFTGRRLLLPKGSKVLGKYDSGPTGDREAVIWDRVVTPNGIDVNMASPGVDNLGGSGHPGYLDSHWGSRIGSALLISMLSDAFKYEGEKHGPTSTTISDGGVATQSPYQSNTAQTLQDLSNQAVQASANRRPTLTINQGTVVNIYVAKDVDFSGVVARL